ncbi:MAG TPA: hypothetical protein VJ858_04255 [Acidimicrobiia bacterium]|nr:hypothetical protein [Acidimicrobiia bacterium]
MRRVLSTLAALVLATSACSSGTTDTSTSVPVASTVADGATTTTGVATTATTGVTGTTEVTSDRPLAPDFTLQLGDGGTYTLSEGSKPVYLVFWAEW